MAAACQACEAAQTDRTSGLYCADCRGCTVRSLATGMLYWRSARAGRLDPSYADALRRVFGDDWQAGHRLVKAEAARLAAMGPKT